MLHIKLEVEVVSIKVVHTLPAGVIILSSPSLTFLKCSRCYNLKMILDRTKAEKYSLFPVQTDQKGINSVSLKYRNVQQQYKIMKKDVILQNLEKSIRVGNKEFYA